MWFHRCRPVAGALAVLAAVAVSGARTPALAARPAPKSPRPPASGQIIYKLTLGALRGMVVLSWIEHGRRYRQEMTAQADLPGQLTTIETWSIGDGKHLYLCQPAQGKQLLRLPVTQADAAQALVLGARAREAGKRVGREAILGRPCEIRQVGLVRLWLWRGLALQMEARTPGGVQRLTALSLKQNVRLDPSLFRVPPGYRIVDLPAAPKAAGAGARQ